MGKVQRGLPHEGEILLGNIFPFASLFEHRSRTQKGRWLRWRGSAFGTTRVIQALPLSTDVQVLILRYVFTGGPPLVEPDDIDAYHCARAR
jgi:hypothetical protein